MNNLDILKNHLKTAVRISLRSWGYSALNILGLATAFSCFAIIMLYISDEISYDRFHEKSDMIFRVVKQHDGTDINHAKVPSALAPMIDSNTPQVNRVTRILQWNQGQLEYGKKVIQNTKNLYVDSSFLKIFTFPFMKGNAESALRDPSSIVLTSRMASKFFEETDAMGQILTFRNQNMTRDYKVTGVIEDIPSQSHFSFDFLLSENSFPHITRARTSWDDNELNAHTYIELRPDSNVEEVEENIQELVDAHKPENTYSYELQAMAGLDGIHLTSHRSGELQENGDIFHIQIMVFLALFIVLIASINYVNLSTARSTVRSKEIGIKKVIGASKWALVSQFFIEALLISFIAGIISIGLTEIGLPFFNSIVDKQLSLFTLSSLSIWMIISLVVLVVAFPAGAYPAFYLSRSKSILALKKIRVFSGSDFWMQRVLVVTQFSLAIVLLIGTLVVQAQLNHIHSKDLGFDKDQVMIISNGWQLPKRDTNFTFRGEVEGLAGVTAVGAGEIIGTKENDGSFHSVRNKMTDQLIDIKNIEGDQNLINAYGLELIEGTTLSPVASMKDFKIVLNQTAVHQLGLEKPVVGQEIEFIRGDQTFNIPICGVIKDFHLSSLHSKIQPIYLSWNPEALNIAIKLRKGQISESIAQIEEVWDKHTLAGPMDFYFLDEAVDRQYKSEANFQILFSTLTWLSLFIACMGLFGLAAFNVGKRTKEIGIKKVLGASTFKLLYSLNKEYVGTVLIANLAAWPIAYIVTKSWLKDFAYQIDIGLSVFLVSGLVALVLAVLTVSFHTYRTAASNPLEALRDE